MTGSTRSSVS
ncbi:hypothetical protein LEMLEM_LOCUS23412 [Lemmus lemmus]